MKNQPDNDPLKKLFIERSSLKEESGRTWGIDDYVYWVIYSAHCPSCKEYPSLYDYEETDTSFKCEFCNAVIGIK